MGVEGVPIYDHHNDIRVFDQLAVVRGLGAVEREHGSDML